MGQSKRYRTKEYYAERYNRRLDDEATNRIEAQNLERLIQDGILVRQGSQRDNGPIGQPKAVNTLEAVRDYGLKTR